MKKPSDSQNNILIDLLGFSENNSIQKSYYPQLQKKIQELEEEKIKYFNLFNNISDALIITDVEGKIIDMNRESHRRYGFSPTELEGKSILKLISKKNHSLVTEILGKGDFQNIEIEQHTKTNERLYSNINIQQIDYDNTSAFLFVCRDVTEKKLLDIELAKAKNYIANIINSMPSILIGIDNDYRITHWNNEAKKWYGKDDDLNTKMLFDIFPLFNKYKEIIKSAITEQKTISNLKLTEKLEDRETVFEMTIFPLPALDNGAVIRIDDISEKVNLEKMMIQSEKMLSLGGLAAGMAHEINNPIAGMIQNANVLKNRLTHKIQKNQTIAEECGIDLNKLASYMEKRNVIKLLDLIEKSGKNAALIIKNMLDFARKSDVKKGEYDIREIIDETLEIAKNNYNIAKRFDFKKIHIEKNYQSSTFKIICNKSQIQQVLLNIFKNGAEAMADSKQDEPAKFDLQLFAEKDYIVLHIIDNGPGIPHEVLAHIFDPFFTTKKPGIGTGLGLSVSYFIITENHNGSIDAERVNPHGTKFTIKLPRD